MDRVVKRERAEARIGQTLEEYFSQTKNEHTSIRTIARDLDISIITAKIWADQYRSGRYSLVFGPLLTTLFVLIIEASSSERFSHSTGLIHINWRITGC